MGQIFRLIRFSMVGMGLVLSSSAVFAKVVQVGDLYYDIDAVAATASVTRNSAYASMTAVEIPGKINVDGEDYAVTSIGKQAFQQSAVETLSVGEGVTEIGAWAFYSCGSLAQIDLPSTLTAVGENAFLNCESVKTLALPDNLLTIESFGFGRMTNLVELTLPAKIKTLTNNAFNSCTNLATVHFNNELEAIDDNAFYGCAITDLVLPEGLKVIGTGAFSNCNKIKSVSFPTTLTGIGPQAFFKCSSLTSLRFPASVKSLGMAAFYECLALNDVILPESLTFIDSNCFYGCEGLTSIEIPSSITTINSGMFYNCVKLSNVKLHAGISEIGESVFYNCQSLREIDLPKGLTKISKSTFNRCIRLKEIEIPESVTAIEDNAFYLCTALEKLYIPENVKSIGEVIVLGCTDLKDITVAENNQSYADISGVLVSKDKTRLVAYPAGRTEVFEMPATITEIDGYVFNSNPNISGIVFSEKLKTIGMSAFYGATGISEIYCHDALENIGDIAFFMNRGIKSFRLPNNDVKIGNNALSGTGISSLVFPEGITSVGISGDEAFSVMGSCASLTWVSLPSTLKILSPLGAGCRRMSTLYSFAVEPPLLKGNNVVDITAVVKVPKGTAEAYAEAWVELYPNLKYDEVLPLGPTVKVFDNTATLTWEAYSDNLYNATPLRYEILLSDNGTVVSDDVLEGAEVSEGVLSHTFSGLDKKTYRYELKGYSAANQLTLFYSGEIRMDAGSIDNVTISAGVNAVIAREYYTLTGQRVSVPTSSSLYIVKTVYDDGSISTTKQIVE